MDEVEVPSFFICPVSLEIMKDPVTLSTGITYDRMSIEKWLFSQKHNTCPATKQVISDTELTPNHTLRRLIQAWCTLNASYGIERIPTPRQPISKIEITKLLHESKSPNLQLHCLKRLKSISSHNETNKRYMDEAGAPQFLASIIANIKDHNDELETTKPEDEALNILYNIQPSETSLKSLIQQNDNFIGSLVRLMQGENYESRTYAVLLLKSLVNVADPMQIVNLTDSLFDELVKIIRQQLSHKATKAAMQVLINVCPLGRNRIKAVNAGAVYEMVDLLLDQSTDRIFCEMALMVLDQLCRCAEGRAELLKHGGGLAVVSKKILRVSRVASERGVRVLLSIAKFSGSNQSVVNEMLQLGVVAKLCLVLQVDCGSKTKEKANEILKLHARAWKNSPCVPPNFVSSYPA